MHRPTSGWSEEGCIGLPRTQEEERQTKRRRGEGTSVCRVVEFRVRVSAEWRGLWRFGGLGVWESYTRMDVSGRAGRAAQDGTASARAHAGYRYRVSCINPACACAVARLDHHRLQNTPNTPNTPTLQTPLIARAPGLFSALYLLESRLGNREWGTVNRESWISRAQARIPYRKP